MGKRARPISSPPIGSSRPATRSAKSQKTSDAPLATKQGEHHDEKQNVESESEELQEENSQDEQRRRRKKDSVNNSIQKKQSDIPVERNESPPYPSHDRNPLANETPLPSSISSSSSPCSPPVSPVFGSLSSAPPPSSPPLPDHEPKKFPPTLSPSSDDGEVVIEMIIDSSAKTRKENGEKTKAVKRCIDHEILDISLEEEEPLKDNKPINSNPTSNLSNVVRNTTPSSLSTPLSSSAPFIFLSPPSPPSTANGQQGTSAPSSLSSSRPNPFASLFASKEKSTLKEKPKEKEKEKEREKEREKPAGSASSSSLSSSSVSSSPPPSSTSPSSSVQYYPCPVCSATFPKDFLSFHVSDCLDEGEKKSKKQKEQIKQQGKQKQKIEPEKEKTQEKEKEKEKEREKEKEIDVSSPPDPPTTTKAKDDPSIANSPSAAAVWSSLLSSTPPTLYHFIIDFTLDSNNCVINLNSSFRSNTGASPTPPSPNEIRICSRIPCPKNHLLNTQKAAKDSNMALFCSFSRVSSEGQRSPLHPSSLSFHHPSYLPCDLTPLSSPSHFDFSPSQLKSLIQKNVRLTRPLSAVRCSIQLIRDYGVVELLRRISIIVIEDSILHPQFPFVVFLLCIASYWKDMEKFSSDSIQRKLFGFTLEQSKQAFINGGNPMVSGASQSLSQVSFPSSSPASSPSLLLPPCWILNILVNFIFEIASSPVKDFVPWDHELTIPSKTPAEIAQDTPRELSPAETCLVGSLLIRENFGGMEGDRRMLKSAATLWNSRFNTKMQQGGGKGWIHFITDLYHQCADQHREQQKDLLSSSPSSSLGFLFPFSSLLNSLTRLDIPLSAIDQHCSNLIKQLTTNQEIIDDANEVIQDIEKGKPVCTSSKDKERSGEFQLASSSPSLTSLLASACSSLDVIEAFLSSVVWECRSSLSNKVILNKSMLNNEGGITRTISISRDSNGLNPNGQNPAIPHYHAYYNRHKGLIESLCARIIQSRIRKYSYS